MLIKRKVVREVLYSRAGSRKIIRWTTIEGDNYLIKVILIIGYIVVDINYEKLFNNINK